MRKRNIMVTNGERALWVAVINQAKKDFKQPKYQKEVIEWINSADFFAVCKLAGVSIYKTLEEFENE